MRIVDVMILAFLGGMQSSHVHVLLNMHYIERWLAAEKSKVQHFFRSLSKSERKF